MDCKSRLTGSFNDIKQHQVCAESKLDVIQEQIGKYENTNRKYGNEEQTESPLNLHTILLLEKQNRLVQACNQSSLSLEEFCNCKDQTLKQV